MDTKTFGWRDAVMTALVALIAGLGLGELAVLRAVTPAFMGFLVAGATIVVPLATVAWIRKRRTT